MIVTHMETTDQGLQLILISYEAFNWHLKVEHDEKERAIIH